MKAPEPPRKNPVGRPKPGVPRIPATPPVPRPNLSLTNGELDRRRRSTIRMMASTKTTLTAMAEMLDMSVADLKRTYRRELKDGHDYVYGAITHKLVQSALAGDVRSMLAWLRQYGGWQEISRRELTGKNGEPISFRNLDASSLFAIVEALGAKGAAGEGPGRTAPQIDLGARDVDDLDALPGPTDKGSRK
ncbi:MAG: hypothetical protein NVS4B8_23650 [Herpetosiphon sp.]